MYIVTKIYPNFKIKPDLCPALFTSLFVIFKFYSSLAFRSS